MVDRRTLLKLGLGALAGACGHRLLLPPAPSRRLEPVDELARRLYDSLDDEQRDEACVGYGHPLRQYHNRGVWGGGRAVFSGFNRRQRQIVTDLFHAGLSEEGRVRVPHEYYTRWSGVHSMRILICGDPGPGPYQIVLTGAHLNLRLGGRSREGAAFGGPQVYGDQRGNAVVGLPGNLYRDQFLGAQRLLRSLDEGRRKVAILPAAPVQTTIELQGRRGSLPGLPVAELRPEGKELVRDLVDRVLSIYPAADAAYARECLAANGGTGALFVSYYGHDEDGDIPEAQVFRLEGPAAVFYFRGHPHVHAFVNVAMDGDAPLSVGEPLGQNREWLAGKDVKALFETALRSETRADLAYYPEGSVAGRLRPGLVRSGDIYSLESWQERAEVVSIRGANLSDALQQSLRGRGTATHADKIYSVATTEYVATKDSGKLGRIEQRRPGAMLRDLTVAYLRAHGFAEPA
jgi:uncharacterized protein DUF3500/5'-nucleotidase-like protein